MSNENARRSGDPIGATAWLGEDAACLEGDEVTIHAELTDVDEIAVVVDWQGGEMLVHLPRVQAIALAGQLAAAATMPPTVLPHGHINA